MNLLAHLPDQADTISVILSESDDTSAADADTGFSDGGEGIQSIVVFSSRDDLSSALSVRRMRRV